MKVIEFDSSFSQVVDPATQNLHLASWRNGMAISISGENALLERYSRETFTVTSVNEEVVRIQDGVMKTFDSWSEANDLHERGEDLLDEYQQEIVYSVASDNSFDRLIFSVFRGRDRKKHFVSFDKKEGIISRKSDIPFSVGTVEFVFPNFYNLVSRDSKIVAYDLDLNYLWEFSFDEGNLTTTSPGYRLFSFNNCVVVSAGFNTREGNWIGQDESFGGSIYSLCAKSGKRKWKTVCSGRVGNIALLDQSRFIAQTENQLIVLCPETGEILQTIESIFPDQMHTGIRTFLLLKMFLTEEYIVLMAYGCRGDNINALKFFRRDSLNLVSEIDFDEQGVMLEGSIDRHHYLADGLLIIPAMRKEYRNYLTNIVIVDLNNISESLSFEKSPSFSVDLPNGENGSLRITVTHTNWEDVIRFGERQIILNLIKVGRGGVSEEGNCYFNGSVRFIVKDSLSPMEILESKLDILKEDLEKYIEEKQEAIDFLHDEPVAIDFYIE